MTAAKNYTGWCATAIWFGIIAGLVEGCGLLVFQSLNRDSWALHVSPPIIGISTVVDVVVFCLLGLVVTGISRFFQKISALRATAVLLTGLTTYDWLTLTARLSSRSRILLALGVAFAFRRWLMAHETAAMRFWKQTLPWVTAVGLLALIGIPGAGWLKEHRALAQLPEAAPGSPNILVIVVDTLRADHLSSYGYSRPTSPNIDRLAGEGVVFDNAVAACSWTYPSHVSMVTGRYMFEHGTVRPEKIPLFSKDKKNFGGYPTIGEALEQRGYRTGAFSGNRFFFVGNEGFHRGFIHFEDYYNSIGDMVSRTLPGKEFLRLYGKFFKGRLTGEWLEYGTNYGIRKRADDVNRELLRWIDRGGPHPFFAFLNYLDVHDPYGGPDSYPKLAPGSNSVDRYDDGVRYTDDYIGRLMRGLAERGLDKNTLVIVTSDHGELLGEHGYEGHGRMLYWELIHVPLVFWYPGHLPAGVRVSQPVTNVAIAATVLDLLGRDSDGGFRGPALDLLWRYPETAADWPDPLSELAQNPKIFKEDTVLEGKVATARDGPLKSLVTHRWHLIIHKKFGDQLYDWVNDPGETNNLISTSGGKDIARDMISRMNDVMDGVQGNRQAMVLANGTSQGSGTGYYRVREEAGSRATIEVDSGEGLDPVISIEDNSGRLYGSCRNPGDDHVQAPGLADPTPDDFDDLCVNDDVVPGNNKNSKLEILVPKREGGPVELYVKVFDWNGTASAKGAYQLRINVEK